jgi:hypothetical protein
MARVRTNGLPKRSERRPHLGGEQLRLFPRRKVAASVHFVEVDELVVAALRPAARCTPPLLIGLLSWTRCLRGPCLTQR